MAKSDRKHKLRVKNFLNDSWQVMNDQRDEESLDDEVFIPGSDLATWMLDMNDRIAFTKQTIRVARKDKKKLIWEVELYKTVHMEKTDVGH